MNKHIDFATLNEYLDDVLPAAARARVAEHLAHCPDCRQQCAALERLFTTFVKLPAAPLTHDLSSAVMKAIAARSQPLTDPALAGPLPWRLLTVQTVMAGAVVVLVWPWILGLLPIETGIAWQRLWWAGALTLKDNLLTLAWVWLTSEWVTFPLTLPDAPPWLDLALPGWGLLLLAASLCWLAGAYWGLIGDQVQNGEEQ